MSIISSQQCREILKHLNSSELYLAAEEGRLMVYLGEKFTEFSGESEKPEEEESEE